MNFFLTDIPDRTKKPRENGLTMMMDKGLGIRETENFIEASREFTDIVKFGFGTAYIAPSIKEKISLYQQAGIRPHLGGTLFEAFYARKSLNDYLKLLDDFPPNIFNISDVIFISTSNCFGSLPKI